MWPRYLICHILSNQFTFPVENLVFQLILFHCRYITCLKGKMHSENLLRSDMSTFNDTVASLMQINVSTDVA